MLVKLYNTFFVKDGSRRLQIGFTCGVALLFFALFYKEYLKEKSDLYFYNYQDIATFVRNVDFFIPFGYAALSNNPVLAVEYAMVSLVTSVITEGMKHLIKEERPDGSDNRSFPSGHTAIAFLVAHFALLKIGKVAGVLLYFIGIVIGFTRVYYHKHWMHDVLFGAVIAIVVVQYAMLCVKVLFFYNKRQNWQ